MKSIMIKIRTENAAFEEFDGKLELSRILKSLAGKIEKGEIPDSLLDFNGNVVGTVTVKGGG